MAFIMELLTPTGIGGGPTLAMHAEALAPTGIGGGPTCVGQGSLAMPAPPGSGGGPICDMSLALPPEGRLELNDSEEAAALRIGEAVLAPDTDEAPA